MVGEDPTVGGVDSNKREVYNSGGGTCGDIRCIIWLWHKRSVQWW